MPLIILFPSGHPSASEAPQKRLFNHSLQLVISNPGNIDPSYYVTTRIVIASILSGYSMLDVGLANEISNSLCLTQALDLLNNLQATIRYYSLASKKVLHTSIYLNGSIIYRLSRYLFEQNLLKQISLLEIKQMVEICNKNGC